MTPKTPAPAATGRTGGRRPSTLLAIYTEQIIGMVTPQVKTRIVDLGRAYGLSQSEMIRRCVQAGLDDVEKTLAADRHAGAI